MVERGKNGEEGVRKRKELRLTERFVEKQRLRDTAANIKNRQTVKCRQKDKGINWYR